MLGLGWPEWLTIIGLLGALFGTFWLMARASVAYEKARRSREEHGSRDTLSGEQGKEGS